MFVSPLRYYWATSCCVLNTTSTENRIFDFDIIPSYVKLFRKHRHKCLYLLLCMVVFTVTISSCLLSCYLKIRDRRYLQNFELYKEAFSYSETSATLNHWTIRPKATTQILKAVKFKSQLLLCSGNFTYLGNWIVSTLCDSRQLQLFFSFQEDCSKSRCCFFRLTKHIDRI